ncbi:site-specific integrase [Flavobacterium sp. CYK-4]|uniref:tyrosine-type recombinase/integrase n=1 Tax=Flavobacterium lotistagni TaxID=2709660 RepID=UPI001409417B|nr:site-specific integrase [Flavobacterium lotistagni]NHM05704.1 site-specific integrase [Flavobacterium lotistagni]
MAAISLFLQNVHGIVHVFTMKHHFSEPKIFTGGVAISDWKNLSKTEQEEALKKDWYLYYSFRDPKTGKLTRQPNIKAGANKFKTKNERLSILKSLQRNLQLLLDRGFSPYADNSELEKQLLQGLNSDVTVEIPAKTVSKTTETTIPTTVATNISTTVATNEKSIPDAFQLALNIKKNILSATSFPNFSSNTKRFQRWLFENGFENKTIDTINKKTVISYLNTVLDNTSARTRNNTRIDLSTLFQTLEDNEIINENFIKKINVLKATPERNKTYTPSLQQDIYQYMEIHDPILLLFVKFISYNYLRPIEVCRLRVEDLDLKDRKLYVKAKNIPVKIKIIPEILLNDLPDLSKANRNDFVFTPEKIGGRWETNEKDKRDYFSKRFKKVKDYFGLGKDYGLYSFRHTFITKLYHEFVKTMTPNEAKSKLMLITGHATMVALEKYLRDIDAVLPEDYSEYL